MKIAIDLSPLHTDHQVRGVGFYTQRLLNSLRQTANDLEIIEVKDIKKDDFSQADLLHIPYFSPFFITLPIINKIPIIVTVHDLIPLKYPEHFPPGIKGKLRWEIQKKLLNKVNMIITDSNASATDISQLTGINKNKIKVVYLAADSVFKPISNKQTFKKISLKYNLPQKYVLYVGDINWNKNVPGLISACQKVKIPLVIVGKQITITNYNKDHPENRDLVKIQEWITKYPVKSNEFGILPLGFVPTEDLVGIYNLAAVYVQASFDEGFGLPVLEAMACGCPTVVSHYGSLMEIVGKASVMVDGYNFDSIAGGIKKVLNNDSLKQQLAKEGIEQTKKFNWGKTAEQTVEIYQQVLKTKL